MIGPLLGALVVFSVTGIVVSGAAGWLFGLTMTGGERLSPRAQVRLARLALLAPPMLGAAMATAVVTPGGLGFADHCLEHADHHIHLCWTHGAPTPPLVASVLSGGWSLFVLARLASPLLSLVRGHRALRRLRALATSRDGRWILPQAAPEAFTAGVLRPQVFVSRGLLEDGEHWAPVLAHEDAHARRGDPLWRWLAVVFRAFHLPVVGQTLVAAHADAQELAADADAADVVGDRLRVAEAITEWTRVRRSAIPLAVTFGDGSLRRRVLALTAERPPTSTLPWLPWIGAALLLAPLVAAPALHHAVETLLGLAH